MSNKIFKLILIILVIQFVQQAASAQFINIELSVEPEISASVEQNLDFGTQVINSGRNEISLGDLSMGIFSIKAYYSQNVYLTLDYPRALTHLNPAIENEIPLELSISYNNSGNNDFSEATPLVNNNGLIAIHDNTEGLSSNEVWQELYLYVYGAITVGTIPNGIYSGDILLTVEYD